MGLRAQHVTASNRVIEKLQGKIKKGYIFREMSTVGNCW